MGFRQQNPLETGVSPGRAEYGVSSGGCSQRRALGPGARESGANSILFNPARGAEARKSRREQSVQKRAVSTTGKWLSPGWKGEEGLAEGAVLTDGRAGIVGVGLSRALGCVSTIGANIVVVPHFWQGATNGTDGNTPVYVPRPSKRGDGPSRPEQKNLAKC